MSFAVAHSEQADEYPKDVAHPKLILIHNAEAPEPLQPVQHRAEKAAQQFGV